MESSVDDLLTLSKLKNTDTSRSITTEVIYQELRQLATMAAMSNAKWVNWWQIFGKLSLYDIFKYSPPIYFASEREIPTNAYTSQ